MLNNIAKAKLQAGFSLVELLIAMTISTATIASLTSFVAISGVTSAKFLAKMRLSEELDTIMSLLTSELRRAGYNGNAHQAALSLEHSQSVFWQQWQLSHYAGESMNSCIEFAYDRNNNGRLDTEDGDERYGFRLRDRALEMRQAGSPCESGGWQDLSDNSFVRVTQLTFRATTEQLAGLTRFQINISLSAHLHSHPELSIQRQQTIRVSNYAIF
ncbi:prepilin-type N-terminal cleavage/methylation domain-containing protein [Aliiglaciecola sp. LCG003]|uniref:prepilin-type N-terminal cleavage/methylation domain-containing protein n=1 Tax=Aliiglaciecola sp. LCG003 TaxID=3053655 RepID=UPI002573F418|nr:prepilin-type N-terminal cleavage/methylation domain-containing protein [Aliiglaciecola sp. LCG003]WJG08494.1 prepilin-type N-terminal cleavage/methylation domain-containing protein [Aliiglaciecola sp. LCG003]